ncbi:MAG: SBBP repeat-containing protein [Bacteroidota bacterium]
MMKSALCLFFVSLSYMINAQGLDFEWAKQFGSQGTKTSGRSITSDPWGNVFSVGSFTGSVDFDPGPGVFTLNSGTVNSTFICKLDSSGSFLWAGKIGMFTGSIISDKFGNVIVMGYLFMSPYDTLDADPGPGIFPLTSPPGSRMGTCIIKLNNAGNLLWAKTFNTAANSGYCTGTSICLDSKQNIYVGGFFQILANFGPGKGAELNGTWVPIQSRSPYPIPSFFICSLDSLGNFRYAKKQSEYSTGAVVCTPQDETISFITNYRNVSHNYQPEYLHIQKRDFNGNLLWSKMFTSGTNPDKSSMWWGVADTDKDGNIWATGYYTGAVDFDPYPGSIRYFRTLSLKSTSVFILKLNPEGNLQKHALLRAAPNQTLRTSQMFIDKEGGCYLGGELGGALYVNYGSPYTSLNINQNNGSLVKLNKDLRLEWAMQIGKNSPSRLNTMCADNFGNLYLSGHFSGSCDFSFTAGTNNHAAVGTEDAYLLKLRGPTNSPLRMRGKDRVKFFVSPEGEQLFLTTSFEVAHGQCRIIDASGKVRGDKRDVNGTAFTMDLTGLQQGFYIVEISDDQHYTTTKIIKD